MKTKDIVTVVVSGIVVVGAIFYVVKMTRPPAPVVENTKVKEVKVEYTGDLNQYKDTLDNVGKFTDYGKPGLDNIGRENPFAPVQ